MFVQIFFPYSFRYKFLFVIRGDNRNLDRGYPEKDHKLWVVFLSGFKRNTPVEYNCYSGFTGDMGFSVCFLDLLGHHSTAVVTYSFFPSEISVYTHLSPWFLGGKSEYILKFPPHTQFSPFALIDYTRAITPITSIFFYM